MICITGYTVSKPAEENMDAFAIGENSFAISDGATQWPKSEIFSTELTNYWVQNSLHVKEDLKNHLSIIQRNWFDRLKKEVNWEDLKIHHPETIAYLSKGAKATLLGVFFSPQSASFQAIAIGDSGLVVADKAGKLIKKLSFPIKHHKDFNNLPNLLSSNPRVQLDFEKIVRTMTGQFGHQDTLFGGTDELLKWILEHGKKAVSLLLEIKNQDDFAVLISDIRQRSECGMDDMTIVIAKGGK